MAGNNRAYGELERWSIRVLDWGVVLIQILLVVGLAACFLPLPVRGGGGLDVSTLAINLGLWVLVLLPVARLMANGLSLIRNREFKLALVVLGILGIIALGFVDYGVLV